MPSVIVAGGGLAGLAAAAALGSAGFEVDLFEARGFLGGRATSFPLPGDTSEQIDNCQHVLLRCCVNLQDFYRRLGVADRIHFSRTFYFIEPGGRVSKLTRGRLPAPLHLAASFLTLGCLGFADKVGIARALASLKRERSRSDLAQISMLDWLVEKRQTQRAIDRFWRQVLVSAVNEDLNRMAAIHGFQVFWLGFLSRADSCEMGVPAVPLAQLYSADAWRTFANVRIHLRSPVERVHIEGGKVSEVEGGGQRRAADYYVFALPPDRLGVVAPQLDIDLSWIEHSPITGVHLWFDRSVTRLPHATLLDRTMQWMFNKSEGRYVQLVVSASRSLIDMSRSEVVDLAVRELGEFFPAAREAKLERSHVIKEMRATYSARPGTEARRPGAGTRFENLFLSGDWTRSGWPATMEGAVRSGYLAAEAVCAAAGKPARFLVRDVAE